MDRNHGFTLLELLIAIFIFGILGTAITNMYIKNTRIHTAQTQVVNTQMNLRAIADYLAMEIRMAGFHNQMPPAEALASGTPVPGMTTATESQFRFTMHDEAAGNLRDLDIRLRPADDANNDGIADTGNANLCIQFSGAGGYQTIAEDIQAIAFAYGYDANGNGAVDVYTTTTGTTEIIWAIPDPAGSGNWMRLDANGDGLINTDDDTDSDGTINLVNTGTAVDVDDIRAVRLTLLGTSDYPDQEFTNATAYCVGRHIIAPNDNIRRRILTAIIQCRNMGG
ncbi:PilW family protein [Desulfuromonas thiophila]|uniref:Prepilin-type N-terminal cleavage/methylation domain-containing protein n=1 Tax=Desulfuromonas thiophila TaxID=57664 RepID=A0A1G7E272_9BACT|nr:prepilin-type N-terminal cleavage/methylation domain-containing protein [Desulfuromonas thiophila]SDE57797.1 prepilin-type N-terminal cleavage/methylation domain-containing protein [Desulfuromonas thiophila]